MDRAVVNIPGQQTPLRSAFTWYYENTDSIAMRDASARWHFLDMSFNVLPPKLHLAVYSPRYIGSGYILGLAVK
jgi:hypothetical protein